MAGGETGFVAVGSLSSRLFMRRVRSLKVRGMDRGGVIVRGNQMGIHAQALLAEVVQCISEISVCEIQ